MRRRTRRSHAIQPEQLEQRALLSGVGGGNVTASVNNKGHLRIDGDEAGNQVWLQQDDSAEPGTLRIWSEGGTTINGESHTAEAPLELTGFRKNAAVDLGDGNDQLFVYGLQTPGHVNLRAGDGNNEIQVDQSRIGGSLRLFGGRGVDAFYVDSSTVGGRLKVRGASGKDGMFVSNTETNHMYLHSGRGSDDVHMHGVSVDGDGLVRGGRGTDFLAAESANQSLDAVGEDNVHSFEDFGVANDPPPNVMDVKLGDAIEILRRPRAGEQQHQQAIDQVMESLFLSNLVPLPTNTDGDQQDPDEQDFGEFQGRMDEAIEALRKHINSSTTGTDQTKADAAEARNFLQLVQEATQVIAGQTAFCDPTDPGNLTGNGCQFLEADDEGGSRVDDVLSDVFSRQVRSPFPIFTRGGFEPNEVVIDIPALSDGQCAAAVKEFFGVKAVVTAREIPIWVEPWFARARIVGTKTVFALEFIPAEYIKTISVCNNAGSIETNVNAVTVHDRGLSHFWKFFGDG